MLDEEDIAGVDHWIRVVTNGAKCSAWERIKTKHAEALKPSHNNARDEISLCGYSGDCGFKGDTGSCNWRHPFCKYRETSPVA